MPLFLIRHAHAVDSEDDFSRVLSSRGRGQVERLVQFFRASGALQPDEVWHSPLARARETARLLADGLAWPAPRTETEILEPNRDPQAVLRRVQGMKTSLALVGHEPLLSALGTLLLKGSPWPVILTMGKADVLCLERAGPGPDAPWIQRWHVGPGLFGLGD